MVRQTSVISPIRCGNPELVNVYKFGVSSGSIKSGVVGPNSTALGNAFVKAQIFLKLSRFQDFEFHDC